MQVIKPKYTTSLVRVKASATIPDVFLRKLIEENRSAISLVVQDGGKIEVEKYMNLGTVDQEFDNVKDLLTNTMKFQRMLTFSQFPAEFDEDEVQPWTIIRDSKKNALLVIGVEGDLVAEKPDGTSEMLACIDNYLGPKIESLYKLLGNDVQKLYAAIGDKDAFGKDLLERLGHRGHFFFMPTVGDVFMIGKEPEGEGKMSGEYEWGAASFAYGHTEDPPQVEEKKVETAPAAPARKVSKYATNAEEPAAPAKPKVDNNGIHHLPEPKPEVKPPALPAEPAKDPVAAAAEKTPKGYWWEPPKDVHGKALKRLYRIMDAKSKGVDEKQGDLHPNWENRPPIFINAVAAPMKEVLATHTAVANLPTTLPVIDGKLQTNIKEFVKKFVDGNSQTVPNPLELQKQEAALPVFSELCLTNGIDEIERWTTAQMRSFCSTFPDGAWMLLIELRRDRIQREATMKVADKPLGELTGTETAPATHTPTGPTPEIPSPTSVHTPRKTSKYA